MKAGGPLLVHVPTIGAYRRADGRIVTTRKFITGMQLYVEHWPGPVEVWAPAAQQASDNLDNVDFEPEQAGFAMRVIDARAIGVQHLAQVDLVFAGLEWRTVGLAEVCRRGATPLVYGTEYTLRTRLQIARAEVANPLRLARRAVWEYGLERKQVRALSRAQGVQCNGTPAYDAYARLTPAPFLFFDSRTREGDMASAAQIEQRLTRAARRPKLQLLFSGRLIEMKGVDQLPRLAACLRDEGLDFALKICGGGALEDSLHQEIRARNLESCVELTGVLDFERELQPLTREWADVFVCPHPQGDPSCTYLETLACGVPIAGYANEAWRGLVQRGAFGVATPVGDPAALARAIVGYARDREALARASRQALAFAAEHSFERTFARRIDHLLQVHRAAQPAAAR